MTTRERCGEGSRERAIAVLSREDGLSAGLVSHAIPLLAGPLSDYAVFALRKVAEERVGQLTDALLDPGQDYKIRRQLARVLSVGVSQRAADALLMALDDDRFDVRFQCARSLAAIVGRNPRIRIDRDRVLEVVLRETAVGRPVWTSRRLLDGVVNESPLDEFVRDRAGQSLAHVFTLLSLVLPSQPLQIAFRSLHSEDRRLRGTALEYLEGVLPAKIRERLWPFLVEERAPALHSHTTKSSPSSFGRAPPSPCTASPASKLVELTGYSATGYQLPATSYHLPPTTYQLDCGVFRPLSRLEADRRTGDISMLRNNENHPVEKSWLDRALSIFADVRAGEGATAALMLVNIFLLLVCYSVIKTVREPLILLGGGAEVRSYAAAGQALLLMGFVPLYSWFASRVDRVKLLVGVTLFFVACIELFAMAVSARVPYIGVAFFIWVGIFNVSLVAQFWSFANDIYSKNAGERLFPIIVIGMTAGAPLGSFVAGQLFRSGHYAQSDSPDLGGAAVVERARLSLDQQPA